jgi:Rrf2 family protein
MNISARCEYAFRAMVELAVRERSDAPFSSIQIAERRNIPEKYLVQILLQLKRAALVHSVRGAQGGYRLARPAQEITLLDIVEAIDGATLDPLPLNDDAAQDLAPIWKEAAQGIAQSLRSITLRDAADRSLKSNMYYI